MGILGKIPDFSTSSYYYYMERRLDSHKGENGKVAIIGGSRFIHGAPLFSALASESSGVDLIYLFVPPEHEEIAKSTSLNFQVRTFKNSELEKHDTGPILQLLASMDSAVIGPGLSREASSLAALKQIVTGAPCPMVLDASALQPEMLSWLEGKTAVLTPHLGELERMKIEMHDLPELCKKHGITMIVKGDADFVVGPDGTSERINGGNAGLTVGGTGDALAGLIAGLIAQKLSPFDAAVVASKTIKHAGAMLAEQQGYAYTTKEVIDLIPFILKEVGSEE